MGKGLALCLYIGCTHPLHQDFRQRLFRCAVLRWGAVPVGASPLRRVAAEPLASHAQLVAGVVTQHCVVNHPHQARVLNLRDGDRQESKLALGRDNRAPCHRRRGTTGDDVIRSCTKFMP